jgi:hypothetical protein
MVITSDRRGVDRTLTGFNVVTSSLTSDTNFGVQQRRLMSGPPAGGDDIIDRSDFELKIWWTRGV